MAQQSQGGFKRPNIQQFIPQGMEDVVARVSAAGQKVMYSPDMRDELVAEVKRNAPVPQKLAQSVVGLMLTLDQQTQGGIPEEALFPAGLDLLGEAAEVLTKAGQPVSQEDYNEAARLMFVLMAKKLGIPDDQIMGAASQAAGEGGAPAEGQAGGAPDDESAEPTPDDEAAEGEAAGGAQQPEEAGEQPGQPDEEEQAMQEGFKR